jgi:G8 domain
VKLHATVPLSWHVTCCGIVDVVDRSAYSKGLETYDVMASYTPVSDQEVVLQGWQVLLDVSTPPLGTVWVDGNLTFLDAGVTLTAANIVVRKGGVFAMGTEQLPLTSPCVVSLTGTRQSPDVGINNDLSLGAKVSDTQYIIDLTRLHCLL